MHLFMFFNLTYSLVVTHNIIIHTRNNIQNYVRVLNLGGIYVSRRLLLAGYKVSLMFNNRKVVGMWKHNFLIFQFCFWFLIILHWKRLLNGTNNMLVEKNRKDSYQTWRIFPRFYDSSFPIQALCELLWKKRNDSHWTE